jgi:hypothetical protein
MLVEEILVAVASCSPSFASCPARVASRSGMDWLCLFVLSWSLSNLALAFAIEFLKPSVRLSFRAAPQHRITMFPLKQLYLYDIIYVQWRTEVIFTMPTE